MLITLSGKEVQETIYYIQKCDTKTINNFVLCTLSCGVYNVLYIHTTAVQCGQIHCFKNANLDG